MASLDLTVILFDRLNLLVKLGSDVLEFFWGFFSRSTRVQAILEISFIGLFSIQQVSHYGAQLLGLGLCLHGRALERELLRGPAIL